MLGLKGRWKRLSSCFFGRGIGNSTWLLRDVWKIVNYNCCFIYIPPNSILYFLRQRNLEFSLHMDFHFPMIKGHKTRKEKKKKENLYFRILTPPLSRLLPANRRASTKHLGTGGRNDKSKSLPADLRSSSLVGQLGEGREGVQPRYIAHNYFRLPDPWDTRCSCYFLLRSRN